MMKALSASAVLVAQWPVEEREREFARWPKYKDAYLRAFYKLLMVRKQKGKDDTWQTEYDLFNWWMEYDVLPGQIDLFKENEI